MGQLHPSDPTGQPPCKIKGLPSQYCSFLSVGQLFLLFKNVLKRFEHAIPSHLGQPLQVEGSLVKGESSMSGVPWCPGKSELPKLCTCRVHKGPFVQSALSYVFSLVVGWVPVPMSHLLSALPFLVMTPPVAGWCFLTGCWRSRWH